MIAKEQVYNVIDKMIWRINTSTYWLTNKDRIMIDAYNSMKNEIKKIEECNIKYKCADEIAKKIQAIYPKTDYYTEKGLRVHGVDPNQCITYDDIIKILDEYAKT